MKFTILGFKLSLCEVKTTNFDINFDFLNQELLVYTIKRKNHKRNVTSWQYRKVEFK